MFSNIWSAYCCCFFLRLVFNRDTHAQSSQMSKQGGNYNWLFTFPTAKRNVSSHSVIIPARNATCACSLEVMLAIHGLCHALSNNWG
ncbi:hypothetical protein F5Y17DRAFT_417204 [Xylariaceae sp. FL0594]|nr:hypothetical protein F5Y17DRAFT_417204 [Xylariaceae sp. FL0594]